MLPLPISIDTCHFTKCIALIVGIKFYKVVSGKLYFNASSSNRPFLCVQDELANSFLILSCFVLYNYNKFVVA